MNPTHNKLLFYLILLIAAAAILLILFTSPVEAPHVPIQAQFENKIVYGTNGSLDVEELKDDCRRRSGRFNECGSVCGPKEEICIQVCAFTCEFK